MFAAVSVTCGVFPVWLMASKITFRGFPLSVMTELMVRILPPSWMNSSLTPVPVVITPRVAAVPMLLALLSKPVRIPPAVSFKTSVDSAKVSAAAALFIVSVFTVMPPAPRVMLPD